MVVVVVVLGLLGSSCWGDCSCRIMVVAVVASESLGSLHRGCRGCCGHLIIVVAVVVTLWLLQSSRYGHCSCWIVVITVIVWWWLHGSVGQSPTGSQKPGHAHAD